MFSCHPLPIVDRIFFHYFHYYFWRVFHTSSCWWSFTQVIIVYSLFFILYFRLITYFIYLFIYLFICCCGFTCVYHLFIYLSYIYYLLFFISFDYFIYSFIYLFAVVVPVIFSHVRTVIFETKPHGLITHCVVRKKLFVRTIRGSMENS